MNKIPYNTLLLMFFSENEILKKQNETIETGKTGTKKEKFQIKTDSDGYPNPQIFL